MLYLLLYGLRPEDIRRLKVENISIENVKEDETGEFYQACVIHYTPCKHGRPATKILKRNLLRHQP
jgi:hypothetical protein